MFTRTVKRMPVGFRYRFHKASFWGSWYVFLYVPLVRKCAVCCLYSRCMDLKMYSIQTSMWMHISPSPKNKKTFTLISLSYRDRWRPNGPPSHPALLLLHLHDMTSLLSTAFEERLRTLRFFASQTQMLQPTSPVTNTQMCHTLFFSFVFPKKNRKSFSKPKPSQRLGRAQAKDLRGRELQRPWQLRSFVVFGGVFWCVYGHFIIDLWWLYGSSWWNPVVLPWLC